MLDQIRKTMEMGVDLALKTKEEVEDMAKDFISKGKLSDIEAKKMLDDLLRRYDDVKKKMESVIEKSVKEILKKVNVASKDEINDLKNEVEKLKQSIKQ
ncbi:MAG: phasin family protein [Desulfobacterales bacterium]|nr:phasin family protein [Desulfobacterales bacterium]MBF0397121.1 phasin family protein [Desulfobacterales bacterium]